MGLETVGTQEGIEGGEVSNKERKVCKFLVHRVSGNVVLTRFLHILIFLNLSSNFQVPSVCPGTKLCDMPK